MNRSLRHALCSTLTFAAAHGAAHAQEASETPQLEEVVVTGRAGAEDIRKIDVSYAITTIDSESLRMDAPLGVADALGSVPGFWVESSGGEGSANIRARGIPTEGFSTVGMLEDGLPIQHDPGIGWLNADQSFRLDDTIERIEVVRGGPSSVFTSNAPGGVVNFVTRRPGTTPEGSVKVESSDYGLMRADAWYGLPVGDWRVGVGGFYRKDDGIRDPGYTANKGGQLRFAVARDFERGSIDFNVKRIDDNVIFYTGLPLTYDADGDAVGVPGIDAHDGTLSGPETRRVTLLGANGPFPLDVERGTDLELTQYTFKFQYELPGDWHLSNGTRYRESETSRIGLFPNSVVTGASRLDSVRAGILASTPGAVDVQLRYTNSPNTVFDLVNQNGNGLITDGSLRQVHVPLDELTNDLRVAKNFDLGGQSHDVAIGLYLAKVDESFDRYSANSLIDIRDHARLLDIVAVDAAGNVVRTVTDHGISRYGSEFANGEGDSKTQALYLSDEWQLNDAWRVDLGTRYEKVSVKGSVERSETVDLGALPNSVADDTFIRGTGVRDRFDTDFDDIGWSAGVNWQFATNSGVFARYTDTFRLPNVGDYISNASATPLKQTMSFTEVGYKYASGPLTVYATAFRTKYDTFTFNDARFNPVTGNFDQARIITDTDTYGLELEGTVSPLAWLDVGFSATLQDPQYGDLIQTQLVGATPIDFDFTGNQLVRIPKLSYRLTPAVKLLNDAMRVELDYQYFGKRYSDLANVFALPSYDVLNANVRWSATNNVTVYLRGENLLDEVGLTEGNPRAGTFVSGEAGSPFFVARPIFGRNYTFSLQWAF